MCLIWGTTWLGIKIGLRTTPPLTGVGVRFFIAGIFLYAIALASRRAPPLSELPWKVVIVLAATLFGLNYVLTYLAETHVASGLVAVLFGTLVFFTFGFGHFLVGERTNPRTWIGAALAFAGVAIISLGGEQLGQLPYALCAIAAAGVSGFANVYTKRHSQHDPLTLLPPAMILAGMVVGLIGLATEHPTAIAFSGSALWALLYLAILGSGVAFFLNLWLLQRIEVWVVGLSALIIPVLAVFVGIAFGGESFSPRDLIGAGLVIAGVWVALAARDTQPVVASVPES